MLDPLGDRLGAAGGRADSGTDDLVEMECRADRAFDEREDRRPEASSGDDAPRHIVCVVVDALRTDAVDASLTPFLADLAGGDAVSPSTWTFPAVTSMLCGRYPHAHGAMRQSDSFTNSVADVTGLPRQSDDLLVPEVFAGAGYETYGAFGFIVPFLALEGRFGAHALYDDVAAGRLLADHAAWLADRHDRPTFSYLHLSDLHEPVDPPDDYWDAHRVADIDGVTRWRHEDVVEATPTVERYRRHRRRLYFAAAEYVDNQLAAHYRRLDDLAGGDLVLMVTGDHGEGFWERAQLHADLFADPRPAYCVGHGGAPYEPITRVPLRATGLDIPPGRRSSLIDVAPTLLAAAGLDVPTSDGRMTVPGDGVALAEPVPDDRRLLVEGCRYGFEKKAVYGDDHKLVVSKGDDVALGLSLPDDRPAVLSEAALSGLRERLPPWPGGDADTDDGREDLTVDVDVQKRLERLGYR